MTQNSIRILIADDHVIVREGLVAIIQMQPNMTIVAEATNGVEAIFQAKCLQPDVILMDLVMPQMDGVAAIYKIREILPKVCILVLTSFADDERVFQAIKAGALGYLLKDAPRGQLLQAIQDVAQGCASLHPQIAAKLMGELRQPSLDQSPMPHPLTERELDTLRLLAQGLTNQEIANQLVVSPYTVSRHVNSILSKLHLSNRTQAALYALRNGLASLHPESEPIYD